MATRRSSPVVINSGNQNIVLIGGALLLGVAYFGVIKPIMEKLHLKDDPKVKAQEQQNNDRLLAWKASVVKAQKPTKSDYEWKVVADAIYNALRHSAVSDNKNEAVYQLCRVKNDADLAVLITLFAKRTEYFFGINMGAPKDLPTFVADNLSAAQIAIVNNNYRRGGIKFIF